MVSKASLPHPRRANAPLLISERRTTLEDMPRAKRIASSRASPASDSPANLSEQGGVTSKSTPGTTPGPAYEDISVVKTTATTAKGKGKRVADASESDTELSEVEVQRRESISCLQTFALVVSSLGGKVLKMISL